MEADRRQDERLAFCMEECKGVFTLEVFDEEYEIEEVNDISLSGIGFEMSTYLDPDTPVKITYEEVDFVVSVTGKVMWCEDHPIAHGNYQLGVLFDYSYRDENSQLFMAIKDYVGAPDETSPSEDLDF